MKTAKFINIFIALAVISIFASCVSSDKVTTGGWLQKRKFNKGFYLATKGNSNHSNVRNENKRNDSALVMEPVSSRTRYIHPALIIPDFSNITAPVFRSEPVKKNKSGAHPVRKKTTGMTGYVSPPLAGFSVVPFTGFRKLVSSHPAAFNWPALFAFIFSFIALLTAPFETAATPVLAFIGLAFAIVSWVLEGGNPDKWKGVGLSIAGAIFCFLSLLIYVFFLAL